MALIEKDRKLIEDCQTAAEVTYQVLDKIDLIIAKWNNGGSDMLAQDVAETFEGVTKQQVSDFVGAIVIMRNSVGTVAGFGQILNIIKMMR